MGRLLFRLADGTILDLARLTTERQADSNVFYPNTPDRPEWRLFAHASLERMIAGDAGPRLPMSSCGSQTIRTISTEIRGRDSNDF